MQRNELEEALSKWIAEALSSNGRLPEGVTPAQWVAQRFAGWWRDRAAGSLSDAEGAAASVVAELKRLGGLQSFAPALHEMAHLREALDDLGTIMGFPKERRET